MSQIAVFPTYKVPSTLLGPSAKAEFHLTPATFASLMPHQQSELCLLAHEAGYSIRQLARMCDLPETTIADVMDARHSFNPASLTTDVSDATTPASADDVRVMAASEGVSVHAIRFLRVLPSKNASHFRDTADLENRAKLLKGSGPRLLGSLYQRGLIARATAKRGFTMAWSLTDLGRSMLARLDIAEPEDDEDL